jgi:mRNA interferase MazF
MTCGEKLDDRIPEAGEVLWVQLAPTMGTEQSGKRPFLVISPKSVNDVTGRIIGVSISTTNHGWETEIPLSTLPHPCVAQADQVRTLDFEARRAEFRGVKVTDAELESVREALRPLVGF